MSKAKAKAKASVSMGASAKKALAKKTPAKKTPAAKKEAPEEKKAPAVEKKAPVEKKTPAAEKKAPTEKANGIYDVLLLGFRRKYGAHVLDEESGVTAFKSASRSELVRICERAGRKCDTDKEICESLKSL